MNKLMDCGRVIPFHVFFILQKSWQADRFRRQGKNLEEGTVKGKEIFVDQAVPGQDVLINADSQQGTDLVVGIKGKSLSISDQDKENVQQKFMMTETGPETMPEKTVFNKGETAINGSDPVTDKWISHNAPPFL
jgi:hypothetical protein